MDKKKIGILTYHYSNNYGAVLQAYSLQTVLTEKGHDTHIINLTPNLGLKGRLKTAITKPFAKTFNLFRQNRLNLYPKSSIFSNNLNSVDFKNFDYLIVGSDQVWRKDYTRGLGYSYFLDFAPKQTKKISYAASFGLDYYSGDQKDINVIKSLLKSFSLVTVREKSGVNICKELFETNAHMVLDPVLLSPKEAYSFKDEVERPSGFITQYLLDASEKKVAFVKSIARSLDKEITLNYKQNSGRISLTNILFNRKKEKFPEISEWIANIKNADLVITDSFHGVAFSILFNKEFICIYNEKRGKTRMQNILDTFNLRHRAISESEIDEFALSALKPIEFNKVNHILETQKEYSLNLLFSNIN
ncbi:polysaccharide pyruvyl transferase family protein [Tamlana crocina]|uniref:Polysaccharide pyruvyl transferase family protein n=1 Tax=Tamlana crocina TaxID=393006 RepID=A0ABX1DA97_9FLAO|nr:polysaccharide pyruvyl transferase family protein [Tamlana crocina]NJX14039.1 polysaccharide pyruvyl transferase family protein [Tamlana crocina]